MKYSKNEKQIKYSYTVKDKHWVGDGFHVHGLIRPNEDLLPYISPFILMDYASPKNYLQSTTPKGVGQHPHRGFETVTIAYQGEVEHHDSSGGGGIIKSGDVQWMTAGKGVVHNEFHSNDFTKKGGVFEMVQLWVNLPKKYKMTDPKYQSISNDTIPKVEIGENKKSSLRVIAGEFEDIKGPASTFTDINMYDISSVSEDNIAIVVKENTNSILLILDGEVNINEQVFSEQTVLIFDKSGENLKFKTSDNFKGLFLNGKPIDETVVAHGPFVMNTKEEINEAIDDFQNGKMGYL